MTIEGYDGERILLSYDVSGEARSAAARVCQIVFGRSGPRPRTGVPRSGGSSGVGESYGSGSPSS